MPDEIKVEQCDREAAASVAVLVEMRELILAGRADHHAEAFARHRIQHGAQSEAVVDRPVTPTPVDDSETGNTSDKPVAWMKRIFDRLPQGAEGDHQ